VSHDYVVQHVVVASFVGAVLPPQATKKVGGGGSFCMKTTPARGALARALRKRGVITMGPLHEIDYARSNAQPVLV